MCNYATMTIDDLDEYYTKVAYLFKTVSFSIPSTVTCSLFPYSYSAQHTLRLKNATINSSSKYTTIIPLL